MRFTLATGLLSRQFFARHSRGQIGGQIVSRFQALSGGYRAAFVQWEIMQTIPEIAEHFKLPQDESGYYVARGAKVAEVLKAAGVDCHVSKAFKRRGVELARSSGGFLALRVVKQAGDKPGARWLGKGRKWIQTTKVKWDQRSDKDKVRDDLDGQVRRLSTPGNKSAGWAVMTVNSGWNFVPKTDAQSHLYGLEYSDAEVKRNLGLIVVRPWNLVNHPFGPYEDPIKREFNLDGAQRAYDPAETLTEFQWVNRLLWGQPESESNLHSRDVGHIPTWQRILDHCGASLDSGVQAAPWARGTWIKRGADYLLAWIACLIREPLLPLPYIFLYGRDQDSGKSIFHEATGLLIAKGVTCANYSLTNQNGFNGELAGAVLAYVEEINLSRNPQAANRLKDWITSPTLWIRRMRTDLYDQPNSLHFIQTANDISFCLVSDQDTRIVVSQVPKLEYLIPKPILLDRLRSEAPNFMRVLYDLELPPLISRLRLPPIESTAKTEAIRENLPPLVLAVCELDFIGERRVYFKDLPALVSGHGFSQMRTAFKVLDNHKATLAKHGITATYDKIHTEFGSAIILERK